MNEENQKGRKKKQLYWLALCGVLAISGVAYTFTRTENPEKEEKKLVDLNEEPIPGEYDDPYAFDGLEQQEGMGQQELAGKEDTPVTGNASVAKDNQEQQKDLAHHPEKHADTVAIRDRETGIAEKQKESEKAAENQNESLQAAENAGETDDRQTDSQKETVKAVSTPKAEELKFSDEEGLIWPLEGNVIKAFSADKMVFFDTLQQFRTNPAIFIAGEPGSEIVAAADGIVKKLEKDDKLGEILTLDIGDGYVLRYGQVKEVSVREGDYVAAGAKLARLAETTKYYRLEGNHLNFQMLANGEPVNPLLYIK